MSANDWKYDPYKVFYFTPENPLHLQGWLEKMLKKEGLKLLTANGDYYIFEPINPKTLKSGDE